MSMSRKSKNLLLLLFAAVIYVIAQKGDMNFNDAPLEYIPPEATVQKAFVNQQSDVQIQGKGRVKKVLQDDTKGSRHQKFILQISPEQTVLVAHNIDVAPRLPGLREGDSVEFYGEYEWTVKGGVIHWTHRDSSGRHIDGWLKYNGKTYQ
jgi:Protein of unknown function (DUF3465)